MLAFAPFHLWPLAILVPALLFWLVRHDESPRRLFTLGWLFGCGYFGGGVYWIYNSLHDFGNAPPAFAALLTALLAMYLALMPALALLCWRYARVHFGPRGIWLLAPAWFGLEWFRGWFLTGMPWLSLGYSQVDSPLAGYAPLVGVYGIGALCVLMAVCLVATVERRRIGPVVLLLAVPVAGYLLQPLDWTEPVDRPLRVTMVQGNIPQQLKWRPDQYGNIFNTYWRETLAHGDSDLVVWPETALPGHSQQISDSLLPKLQEHARREATAILSGLVYVDPHSDAVYNSVMLFGRDRGLYHKRHLVVFGEYYPMRWLLDLFRGLIDIPYSDLAHGPDEQASVRLGDHLLGVSICWEDVFSRAILRDLPQSSLLVNVSNDAWFGNSTAPHQHLQIAQMRSLETGRAMIRATNTGVSAFIDHRGRIVGVIEQFRTATLTEELHGRTGVTPFFYFARVQWLFVLLPAFLLIYRYLRRD